MSPLPFFYKEQFSGAEGSFVLDEVNSKHIVQVLRMKRGERFLLTDGKGRMATTSIIHADRKHCVVEVLEQTITLRATPEVTIAISMLKNTHRMEWFLEKVTEIGVAKIVLLVCKRTEKEKFRQDRITSILVSAMLQSRQAWLPQLEPPVRFQDFIPMQESLNPSGRFIAHCAEGEKRALLPPKEQPSIILIGPEGDFTPEEIDLALESGYQPISLGATRLRTETAGIVAAALLKQSSCTG